MLLRVPAEKRPIAKDNRRVNIDAYLQRINYHGSREPSAATLRALQLAHLQSVPFENLSIYSNEPIVLEDEALFEKVVLRRRGGFCYELNGLFAALLRALGFEVEMLSAEVAKAQGEFTPEFAHMTLMVTLDQPWLADVGFGDSFREPLLLDFAGEQSQGERSYKIVPMENYCILMQRDHSAAWEPQYRFTLQPYNYADYEAMCVYQATSPESHFTQKRICTRTTSEGRLTLSEMRLITSTFGHERQERTLTTAEEYELALREQFGIVMAK
ncbi:MAG: N-hydroxyarylamine O-acetyltransferase [Blastocatellia bacterium]|nr:N-hydroxyarylamine O-acetyltransferase [Blastocatellia bacterium]